MGPGWRRALGGLSVRGDGLFVPADSAASSSTQFRGPAHLVRGVDRVAWAGGPRGHGLSTPGCLNPASRGGPAGRLVELRRLGHESPSSAAVEEAAPGNRALQYVSSY